MKTIEEIKLSIQEMEQDAKRYRYLRLGKSYQVKVKGALYIIAQRPEKDYAEALDKSIDEEMKSYE